MTKGSLQFVPEGWRVVPEEPTDEMYREVNKRENESAIDSYDAMPDFDDYWTVAINSVPQLTTPPVLRWEGEWLYLGTERIAISTEDYGGFYWATLLQNDVGDICKSIKEGCRAAEKALGIPFEV